jgi:hypothetical protein
MRWRRVLIAIVGVLACLAAVHPSDVSARVLGPDQPAAYAVPDRESPAVQATAPERLGAVGRDAARSTLLQVLLVAFAAIALGCQAHAMCAGVDRLQRGWQPVLSPRGSPPLRRGPPS